jgi:hypothetical protein
LRSSPEIILATLKSVHHRHTKVINISWFMHDVFWVESPTSSTAYAGYKNVEWRISGGTIDYSGVIASGKEKGKFREGCEMWRKSNRCILKSSGQSCCRQGQSNKELKGLRVSEKVWRKNKRGPTSINSNRYAWSCCIIRIRNEKSSLV